MSTFPIPPLIHHRRQARNGMIPASQYWRQLIRAENHITAYRHRPVFQRTWELGVAQINTTAQTIARWRFRTGYGVSQVAVLLLLGGSDANAAQIQPAAYVDLTISGGATTTLGPFIAPILEASPTDAPDEQRVEQGFATVTENTVYECALRITGYAITGSTSNEAARVLAICVYELASSTVVETTNYMNTHQPIGGSPIYDADRERLLVGLSNMYRYNGGINAHWGLTDGAAQTSSSATAANLIDGSTTGTPTTAHPGWYIDPRYHRTQSRTTVQFEWAVYASIPSSSGTCRIIDTAGNTYGSITVNNATPQWFVSSVFNVAESAEIFLVPQFAGSGAQTISVYAASLIEYDG